MMVVCRNVSLPTFILGFALSLLIKEAVSRLVEFVVDLNSEFPGTLNLTQWGFFEQLGISTKLFFCTTQVCKQPFFFWNNKSFHLQHKHHFIKQ